MKKQVRSRLLVIVVVLLLLYFLRWPTIVLLACGLYDVSRNRPLTLAVVDRYFFGNGLLTWLLSPFNVVMDILTLPYVNKGIYKLDDLPTAYRTEVERLLTAANTSDIVAQLEEVTREHSRSMLFFKWYGRNINTKLNIPAFHEDYRFVKTIGVSVFNKKQSTSKHFGPVRATLRVLYNINEMKDDSAYIQVGGKVSYWRTDKLFIFDDTLQHQSFNESDNVRYCLFVDILRPALIPQVMASIVGFIRFALKGMNYVFYKNWDVIQS